jgi:hypothetical protein
MKKKEKENKRDNEKLTETKRKKLVYLSASAASFPK